MKELNYLLSSIKNIKGIGEKSYKMYHKLLSNKRFLDNEVRVLDLLYHKPIKLQLRQLNPNLNSINNGDLVILDVIVDNYEKPQRKNQPHKIRCLANTGFINIVFFNYFPDFLSKHFKEGNKIRISGKIEKFNNELQITHPDYINTNNIPNFETIYPLTAGLSNKVLRNTIQNILKNIPDLPEWLDNNFIKDHNWLSWKDSITSLHNATEENHLYMNSPYIERLVFDEILANQITLQLIKEKNKITTTKNVLLNQTNTLKDYFIQKLPFQLTKDQKNAITEIENDIYSNKRMLRLLQGDVGSGKTVVSFLSMLSILQNNKQVALMVPTSILATQHYEWIKKMCETFNNDINKTNEDSVIQHNTSISLKVFDNKENLIISNKKTTKQNYILDENKNIINNNKIAKNTITVGLLTGKIKGKKREKILEDLKNGKIDIIIGTHAIFQENVKFHDLGYVIIDEQHRFGVAQRLNLIKKGENTNLLIMTATPIPRTLSLTLYGDLDVSIIKEKPKNRKEIITSTLSKTQLNELIIKIKQKILEGEKIYWICPLIEEAENLEATPLFQRYEEFKNYFKEEEIGFIHGKLTEDEKDNIMEKFSQQNGTIKILIATTVIEVGIDVPDATIIVIENPDRFGLSQMHQLRGRVGRGDKQSYCILLYNKLTNNLKKRMEILKNNNDGFYIAEEDLKLRGSGEILGKRQSGYQEYLIADFENHYHLFIEASQYAKSIIKDNNKLYSKPIQILLELFGYTKYINESLLN